MDTLQKDGKSLQESGVKQWHIVVALAVGLLVLSTTFWSEHAGAIVGAVGLAILAALFTWNVAEKVRIRREEEARAWAYANVCGPVLIQSQHPNETVEEVAARAAEFRRQMELAGNPYFSRIPLVVYPYRPMMFGQGHLTMSWNVYQRMAGEQLHNENLVWSKSCPPELMPIFMSQVMPAPNQPADAQ